MFKPETYAARLKALRARMKDHGVDAFVFLQGLNSYYLTGFKCSNSVLVVDARSATYVTDFRYGEMAEQALGPAFKLQVTPTTKVEEWWRAFFSRHAGARLGFEESITVAQLDALKKRARGAKWVKAERAVLELRAVKSPEEIAVIRKAAKLADKMMALAFEHIRPGTVERDLSRMIRRAAEDFGGDGESFPSIVASGVNASRPHHQSGSRKMRKGDMVTVDLGGVFQGYCSDLTRNPVIGNPSAKFEEIYEVCLYANEEAIRQVRSGMKGREADAIARDIIASAGYGDYFGHGLGHGVGLQIHEAPGVGRLGEQVIQPGNIITIEPGIYIPGFGGVRIEDYCLVREDGLEVLSKFPKQLTIL